MSIPFSLFSSLNTFIPDGLVEDMFFLFGKQIDKMEKECFWTQEDIVELPEWQKQVRNSVNNTAVKRELYRIEEGIIYSCRNGYKNCACKRIPIAAITWNADLFTIIPT